MFQETSRDLLRSLDDLDVTSLTSTVNVLSKGGDDIPISVSRIDQHTLTKIEGLIMAQFDSHMAADMSTVI